MSAETIIEFLKNYAAMVRETAFLAGVVSGFVLVLLFAIVLLLILLLSGRKRLSAVLLKTPHGTLSVSSGAVADLIRSLDLEFKDIELHKIYLSGTKKGIRIDVQVDYRSGGSSLPETAAAFEERTLDVLKKSFGIDSVSEIRLKVRRTYHPKNTI